MKKSLISILLTSLLFGCLAQADISLSSVSQTDFDNIAREYSNNSIFSSVSPASGMGSIWGVEAALMGGMAPSPDLNNLVQQADPSTQIRDLYHGGLLLGLTVPFGLTAELLYLPKFAVSGVNYNQTSLALKWNFYDFGPTSLAVRGFYSTSQLKFSQTINGVNADVSYNGHDTGVQLLVSENLIFVKPYAGIGYITAQSDMEISANSNYTFFTSGAQTASSNPSSFQPFIGAQFNFLLLVAGAEYSHAFNRDRYDIKLGFEF